MVIGQGPLSTSTSLQIACKRPPTAPGLAKEVHDVDDRIESRPLGSGRYLWGVVISISEPTVLNDRSF